MMASESSDRATSGCRNLKISTESAVMVHKCCRKRGELDSSLLPGQADDLGLEMIEAQCVATGDVGEDTQTC